MGPTWGRQDPGGPHMGHVTLAILDSIACESTHSLLDKMAAILQTTFSNEFSLTKIVEVPFKFLWNLIPIVHFLQWSSIGSGNGFAPNRQQAWINDDPVYRRIYASIGKMSQLFILVSPAIHLFLDCLNNRNRLKMSNIYFHMICNKF